MTHLESQLVDIAQRCLLGNDNSTNGSNLRGYISQTNQILKGIMVASVVAPTSNLHLLHSCGSRSFRLSFVPLALSLVSNTLL